MVNYIKHLESVTLRMADDGRLNTSHVSMYLALFLIWNHNRFQNPLSINRSEVMKISKIGSQATYHKCMNGLHNWDYLKYEPSHNPLKGSLIHLFNFDTTAEQVPTQPPTQAPIQVVDTFINNTKQKKHTNNTNFVVPTLEEIKAFFKNDLEAEKFFNYYNSNGWLVGGRTKMKNWNAAASNWLLNLKKFNPKTTPYQTTEDKDYTIPL